MNSIDICVGRNLRDRRIFLGMTQEELGKAANITYQQIQKYESGSNRIGASRLYKFANILKVDISYFFKGIEEEKDTDFGNFENILWSEKETLSFLKAYYSITNGNVRKNILSLMQSLVQEEA